MRTKHASLDRKLFNWVREHRTKLTVANTIYVLRIYDKSERRHITRRFAQMCARGMLRLVGQSPAETYEVCGAILEPGPDELRAGLERIGATVQQFIQAKIREGLEPPLAESTVERNKGETRPLASWLSESQALEHEEPDAPDDGAD